MLPADNLDQLGPHGVTVRCDQLSVAEMLLPVGGRRSFELEARGNAVVESNTFTALGQRITYDEAKDLLILSGDGRNAELFRQLQVGASATTRPRRGSSTTTPGPTGWGVPAGRSRCNSSLPPRREWKTLTSPRNLPMKTLVSEEQLRDGIRRMAGEIQKH